MSEPQKYPRSPEGTPCWIEIPARDLQKMKQFYATIFPEWTWRTPDAGDDGHVLSWSAPKPSTQSGGLVKMPDMVPRVQEQPMGSGFTVYYFVDSIEEATAHIEKAGGKLVLPKTKQGDSGWFANLTDVEGNRFGIYTMNPEMLL